MTTVRLAVTGSAKPERITLPACEPCPPPILVSYFYLPWFDKIRDTIYFRDWVMDSGAFSAANSGAEIDLSEYIDCCLERLENDPKLIEVYSLDVIGDHGASMRNWQKMLDAGVPAIPTFHFGSAWSALDEIKHAPKIALGGMVGKHAAHKLKWAEQCFARVWPKRIHGFGLASKDILSKLPFHSVDATNWILSPSRYGRWKAYPDFKSGKGPSKNLRAEVEWYLKLERELQARWSKVLAGIPDTGETNA